MEFVRDSRLPAPATDDADVVIAAPPEVPRATPASPFVRLVPMVVAIGAIAMGAVYIGSGAATARSPMMMFFPLMMAVSMLGSLVYGGRTGTRVTEIDQDRRDYLCYLTGLHRAAAATAAGQRTSLYWRHPDPATLWMLVGTRRMWERTPHEDDFCQVRIGLGRARLSTRLIPPELGSGDERDPVTTTAVKRLVRCRSLVDDMPIALALRRFPVIAVDGDLERARALVRAMVCQLTTLHSPADVAVAAVVEARTTAHWDWLKWLSHHQEPALWDDAGPVRRVYRSLAAAEQARGAGHLVVVVDGVAFGAGPPAADTTVLMVGSAPEDALAVRIGTDGGFACDEARGQGDALTISQAVTCARRLASVRIGAESAAPARPTGWAELMGIGDPARIDADRVWRPRPASRHLRVPIGVDEQGAPVELDIKEAAQHGMGPHGLCVGATGSGKSEFLRTLTLGMITTHPPDVLNLILVDFKGGATFHGLEDAPGVTAVITNLADAAHLVARMRDALAGEMHRRQEVLRAAGNLTNVGDYRRVRAQNPGLAPLPALLIVVDEFSELLSQHPDFAELFVAIGRLGRSLGMHLLLASQRLDEGRLRGLETHLSYRVCLKTFSAGESRAVLGIPDACQLPSTPGAAYLKTADGELLRFHTAFVSGPYRAAAPAAPMRSMTVQPRLFTAAPVGRAVRLRTDEATSDTGPTVLEVVRARLTGHGPAPHRVWLPPLAESPVLDVILNAAGPAAPLTVPIGLIDSPFQQRRDPLVVALSGAAGNAAVVGGPRSGKSTVLRTLMLALAATHDPLRVQFYCLDFGGGTLASVRDLPHVGTVAGRLDADLVRRTVAELEATVRRREREFGRQHTRLEAHSDVFLVVDGWAAIRQEFEPLEAPITSLASQGLAFGVHVIVAASRWAEIRPALKDQLGTRIELRLGDPAESEMDRKRARLLADRPPGRGLTPDGRETAIAVPRPAGMSGLDDAFAASAQALRARHTGRCAPPIELLPSRVAAGALADTADDRRSPLIGLGERELQPIALDFTEQASLVVLGESGCGKTATLRLLCNEVVRTHDPASAQLIVVDFRRTLLGVVESEHLAGYVMSPGALDAQLPRLIERLRARMPGADISQQQLRARSWWSGPDIYVVVDDYDLVAAAAGNPLTALADFLPHATDLGLHVILARRSGGAARAMFDPVLGQLRDLGCMGLMMSAGPEDGVLLGSVRPCPLPPGRGVLITRARPAELIQVAWSDPP